MTCYIWCEILEKYVLREFKSVNWLSIRKYNYSDKADGFDNASGYHMCGGVLITAIFGVSTAITMLKDSFDILLQSRAGEHDITKHEGHEQL